MCDECEPLPSLAYQVISPEVARAKGVCQCCLMDMEFNLPVGVRDALLKGSAEEQALLPQSGVNQTYFYDQVRRPSRRRWRALAPAPSRAETRCESRSSAPWLMER